MCVPGFTLAPDCLWVTLVRKERRGEGRVGVAGRRQAVLKSFIQLRAPAEAGTAR